jgi:hypothetical protein
MKHGFIAAFAFLLLPLAGRAQEPTFMEAATHPGQGQFYSRALLFASEDDDYATLLKLSYGIVADLALQLDGQYEALNDASDLATGSVRLKYRILQRDLTPLNTWRASILAGAEKAEGIDTAARLGLVTTTILDRHGLNGQVDWTGTPSEPDEFEINVSHLYRIVPAEYAADTKGAWYTMLESLNTVRDNGDYRIDVAPGLLYEAAKWAAEASIRLNVAEEGDPEPDYIAALGLRYLF